MNIYFFSPKLQLFLQLCKNPDEFSVIDTKFYVIVLSCYRRAPLLCLLKQKKLTLGWGEFLG